ncbi:MAG: signal peptidase I [Aeromicrobium sp.]
MSEHTRTRSVAGWFGQVIAWFVISAVVALLAVCVVIPRLGGATPYSILTSSMEPDFPPGTLVVIKPASTKEINVGDVITYQLKSGDPTVVTHRVIAITTTPAGELRFHTQGDANNTPDPKLVVPEQIKGKLWYSAPQLGRVTNLLDNAQRHAISVLIVSGLLAYAAYMFVSSTRERRKINKKEEVQV